MFGATFFFCFCPLKLFLSFFYLQIGEIHVHDKTMDTVSNPNFREYFNSLNNKMKHVSRERFFIKTNYYHYHYLFTFILLFIF